jgi:small subunit ribosomal protein S18
MTLIFRIFKNLKKLKPFVTEQGRIFPRRITGLTTKQQRGIKKNIKQARILSFLAFSKIKLKK